MVERTLVHRGWYALLRFLARVLFICLFRVRVFGRNNVPRTSGAVLASNHQSFLDPILVGLGLDREVHFMARDDLFDNPFFGTLIRSLNAFPVRRGKGDRTAIREALRLVSAGELLVVFPEGTRNDSGSVGELQAGVALIAKQTGCPIVPVAISGAHRAWPSRYGIFHFCPIQVRFAPAIDPSGKNSKETAAILKKSIGTLLNPVI